MKNKKKALVFDSNWHPNFRVTSELPDLKVVRTDFFVNLVAVSIAIVCVLLLGFREYKIISINNSITNWEKQIEASRADNRTHLKLSSVFEKTSKKVDEVDRFITQDIVASRFLIALSETIPSTVAFSNLSLTETRISLSGLIRGSSEAASNSLSDYLDVLRGHSDIGSHCENISLTSFHRNPHSGMQFEITLMRSEGDKKGR